VGLLGKDAADNSGCYACGARDIAVHPLPSIFAENAKPQKNRILNSSITTTRKHEAEVFEAAAEFLVNNNDDDDNDNFFHEITLCVNKNIGHIILEILSVLR